MLLAMDIGNSQTVVGVYDGTQLLRHWRVSTEARRTSDELALQLQGLLRLMKLSLSDNVSGVVISSVVPPLTEAFREMADRYLTCEPVVVGPGIRTGIAIRTDNPREVGADRLVNALAAFDKYGGPGIVVDFGTATSFDVYDDTGAFLGGAIAPGVQTSMAALSARGAQLGAVELAMPDHAIGRSTVESMQAGAIYGFAGQVDRLVEALTGELPAAPVVVATGGLALPITDICRHIDHHDQWLTLRGLRLVWERNR
ncbi:MAG: type III pantothenate kinase [Actinobacteria bacterium]|nr:type III pantothenate kinase [Actinomycetota bacterium]